MRRGINIRKKKKIMLKEINYKYFKLLLCLAIILFLSIYIFFYSFQNIFIKKVLENESINFYNLNNNIPFSLKKIILFSSAIADTSTVNQSLLNLDISQYCDIGIYLNNSNTENITISSLYIDNISISSPEIGTPFLYNKTVLDFGKCTFTESNIINNRFDYNIVSTENILNYENYEIYDNGVTPISLGFYNKNIKTNFLSTNSEILYNGFLFKEASISLSDLICSVSFTINIVTTSNEHYICNVNFDIPTEDSNSSIYDNGYITKEIQTIETNKFIRIK